MTQEELDAIEALASGNAEQRHEAAAKIPALVAEVRRLREERATTRSAIVSVLKNMSGTYKYRGREMFIEAMDGEKCWIVHSDDIYGLQLAVGEQS